MKYIEQQFIEMNRLYHFTNNDAAYKIIQSGKLRFGKQSGMNDLLESNRITFEHVLSEESMAQYNSHFAEKEMHRYQQISFTQDREYGDMLYLGFDLHSMWGLYAQRGYGVCLVFDKDRLKLNEGDYANNVDYYDMPPTNYGFHNRSNSGLKAEIWRRRDEIFFVKRKEWEYEQEYRVIRRAKKEDFIEYLDITNSLAFVILCRDSSIEGDTSVWYGDNYFIISSLKRKLPVLSYEDGLDGYTLWPHRGDPIWTEQCGFM